MLPIHVVLMPENTEIQHTFPTEREYRESLAGNKGLWDILPHAIFMPENTEIQHTFTTEREYREIVPQNKEI